MFFFQLPFDLLLDVGHASGVVVKVFVLVGHHFIQEGLVRGLGFRFGFLTVGVVDPKVDSRFRQLGFRSIRGSGSLAFGRALDLSAGFPGACSVFPEAGSVLAAFGVSGGSPPGSCGGASPGATAADPVPPS